jgi:hypothetical protein
MTAVQPEPGDFALTQIHGAVGLGVRIGQYLCGDGFRDYEHVLGYCGGGMIQQAEPGGIQIRPLSIYDPASLYWSTGLLFPTPAQRAGIVAAYRRYADAHTGYSFLDYDAIAARRLGIPSKHLVAYIRATGHMICSQDIARCWFEGGYPLWPGEWTGYDTPGDFCQLLDARKAAR